MYHKSLCTDRVYLIYVVIFLNMNYSVQSVDYTKTLVERLMCIRGICDDHDDFFSPTFRQYWITPSLLSDFDL